MKFICEIYNRNKKFTPQNLTTQVYTPHKKLNLLRKKKQVKFTTHVLNTLELKVNQIKKSSKKRNLTQTNSNYLCIYLSVTEIHLILLQIYVLSKRLIYSFFSGYTLWV